MTFEETPRRGVYECMRRGEHTWTTVERGAVEFNVRVYGHDKLWRAYELYWDTGHDPISKENRERNQAREVARATG